MEILALINANHDRLFYVLAGTSFILELSLLRVKRPTTFFCDGQPGHRTFNQRWTDLRLGAGETLAAAVLTGPDCLSPLETAEETFRIQVAATDTSSDMIGRVVTAEQGHYTRGRRPSVIPASIGRLALTPELMKHFIA